MKKNYNKRQRFRNKLYYEMIRYSYKFIVEVNMRNRLTKTELNILEATFWISCQEFSEETHPRYPKGTYKDGENVGGQFRGKEEGKKKEIKEEKDIPSVMVEEITPSIDLGFFDISGFDLGEAIGSFKEEIGKKLQDFPDIGSSVQQAIPSFEDVISTVNDVGEIFENITQTGLTLVTETALDPVGVGIAGLGVGASIFFTLASTSALPVNISAANILQISGLDFVVDALKKINPMFAKGLTKMQDIGNKMGKKQILAGRLAGILGSIFALRKGYDVLKGANVASYQREKVKKINEEEDRRIKKDLDSIIDGLDPEFEEKTGIPKKELRETLSRKFDIWGVSNQEQIFISRIKELNELVKDGKQNSPKGKWRTGIVKAEINYGEDIDKLAMTPVTGVDAIDNIQYNKFLEKMRKKEESDLRTRYINKRELDMRGIRFYSNNDFKYSMSDKMKSAKKRIDKSMDIAKELEQLSNAENLDLAVTATDPIPPFTKNEIDAFQIKQGDTHVISMGKQRGFLNNNPLRSISAFSMRAKSDRSIMFHEMGHAIEINANMADESSDFINDRKRIAEHPFYTGDYTSEKYGSKILGLGGTQATEVVSMGTQQLAHATTAKLMAARDREHFLYTLYSLEK